MKPETKIYFSRLNRIVSDLPIKKPRVRVTETTRGTFITLTGDHFRIIFTSAKGDEYTEFSEYVFPLDDILKSPTTLKREITRIFHNTIESVLIPLN